MSLFYLIFNRLSVYFPGSIIHALVLSKIDGFLHEREQFTYTYDFGDNWEHEVVVEKILAAGEDEHHPRCIGGERHRPPQDVGGAGGYASFLKIIVDPKHPEHDDYLAWAEKDTGGRKFDPDYFYLNEVNKALARIKVTEKKAAGSVPPKKAASTGVTRLPKEP